MNETTRRRVAGIAALLACRAAAFAGAAGEPLVVEGDCHVAREGILFVYVVDEKRFSVPNAGLREARLRVGPAEAAAGRVHFLFNLPAGRYGVRCFLDLNGNGRLDKGPFGPTEPWGMSWNGARRSGFPRFGDIAFRVDRDIRELEIEVK